MRVFWRLLLLAMLAPVTAAPVDLPYPHLANVYLSGEVDDTIIAALAQWDLVVLHETWTDAQLDSLRALNPDIKIFFYVIAYAVPLLPSTPWSQGNMEYVRDNDLWWYDTAGQVASDWPGTGMVNITGLAPWGPEGGWRDFWVARVDSLVQQHPQLDGVYLDNFWQQISWQQPQRHLDSDCNPTHNPAGCDGSEDSPAHLDSLWHDALVATAAALRARFDTLELQRGRPLGLLSNGASDYFTWLNGTLYEYFPSGHADIDVDNPYGYNWNREMWDAITGYVEAPFRRTPVFLSILNSEYWGTRWTPARNPGFERHKRFTLVSSLLGSGYYSLDAGHAGNANLWWEPEYDADGRGKGYLGQPLGPAQRLLAPVGAEMLTNADFSAGDTAWPHHASGAEGSASPDADTYHSPPLALRVDVLQVFGNGSYKVWQHPLPIVEHQDFTLSFWAKGTGVIAVHLYGDGCPAQLCWGPRRFRLRDEWTRFETSFHAAGSSAAGLDFFFATPGSAWLDDVSLRRGDTALFRRDFEHGIVLLNYTIATQAVPLETTFHRLLVDGSDVFDGAAVVADTVPPSDARILMRTTTAALPESGVTATAPGITLAPNRPNPFNPATEIRFHLARAGAVHLALYNAGGRRLRVLVDGERAAGEHVLTWDGRDAGGGTAPSGVYLLRLVTPEGTTTRKLVLAH